MGLDGTIRGKVEIDGTRKTTSDLKRLEKQLDDAGKRGFQFGEHLRRAGPGIAVGVAAIGAATMAARELARVMGAAAHAVHAFGMAGGAFSPIATAFESIASPELLARMHEQTGWLIDEQRLMQESVQVLRARMLTEGEWVESLAAITRLSQDAGEEADQMVRAFADIAAGGGAESLQRLGVNVSELRDRLREAGVSGESMEGRMMILHGALDQFRDLVGDASNEAGNYADATDRLTNRFNAYRLEAGRVFAENEQVVESMRAIEDALVDAAPDAENLGEAIAELTLDVTESTLAFIDAVEPILDIAAAIGAVAQAVRSLQQIGNFPGHIAAVLGWMGVDVGVEGSFGAGGAGGGSVGDLRRRLSGIRSGGGGSMGQSVDMGADPWAMPALPGQSIADVSIATRGRGGGGGGGGRAAAGMSGEQMLTLMQGMAEAAREIAEQREAEADVLATLKDQLESITEIEEERASAAQAHLKAEVDALAARQEAEELFIATMRLEAEIQREAEEKGAARMQQTIQDLDTTAGSIAGIFGQIAEAEEKAGRAADGWRVAEGVALGIYHTVKSLGEGAEAFASFASQRYDAGVMHAIAQTSHAVAAGIAFSQLAQTGGGGSAAATAKPSSFRPASTRPEATGGMGDAGNTVNIYSWGRSQADAGRVVAEADWARVHKGAPLRIPRGIGFEA